MGATQGRVGLFSLGTWLLASLIVVDAVWAEGEVSFIAAPEVGVGRNPLSIAVGDFNGDGQPDLATANIGDGAVSILLGGGNGTFQAALDLGVGAGPLSVTVGDFNGDGRADLATANIGDGAASILLGGGDGTFQASPDVVVGAGPTSIAVGDFNDDGRLDLATANISVNNVSIRLGQGDGTFRVAPDVGVGASPQSIAVGDFNRDGRPDLATANGTFPEPGGEPTAGTVSIRLGQGDGTFRAVPEVGVGVAPLSITAGDFNGDTRPDVATANAVDNTVSILLGRGDGTFQAVSDVGVGASPQSITGADFNGDGRADLATANARADTVSVLLGRGGGTFQAAQDFGVRAGASAASIAVGDFDGDGRPDVATANSFANTVSILINNTADVVVNDLVTFEPIEPTLAFTPDPTGCPAGFTGVFRFEARLTNTSEHSLADLVATVATLSEGNLLQNADGRPGGVGARLTMPREDGFTDGALDPDEFVDAPFVICVAERQPFTFAVDVLGAVE